MTEAETRRLAQFDSLLGADQMRRTVRILDQCDETFLDRFSVVQLHQLARMAMACDWDFMPDTWHERQIAGALAGIPPRWDDREMPVYE